MKEEDFEENIQHGMKIVEKFLSESETQVQEGKTLIKVEFEDMEKKIKTEVKEEDFEEDIQLGMEIVEKFLNESETQVQEGKNLIKVELKDMEKSTKSEFQTEIKPKTEEKKEDFEEHVQHGMEIVEKFLNESETQLQAGKNLIKVEFEDLQKSTKSEFKAEIKPKTEVKKKHIYKGSRNRLCARFPTPISTPESNSLKKILKKISNLETDAQNLRLA